MGKEKQVNFIFELDLTNSRWLRLDIVDNKFQLFANPDNTEDGTWTQIDFPEALTAWDPKGTKAYRYFIHERKLHRYSQVFSGIIGPSDDINEINEKLKKLHGFVVTNDQKRNEIRAQFIQVFDGEKWEFINYVPLNAKNFYIKPTEYSFNKTIEEIPANLLLPKSYTPSLLLQSVSESSFVKSSSNDNWYQEREVLPNFQLPLETTLPKSITWQLDNAALTLLRDFKGTTNTKQEYLSSLEIILDNESIPEHLRSKNQLLFNIAGLRAFIRSPGLNLDDDQIGKIISSLQNEFDITREEAEKIFRDSISLYLLTRFKQEYETVADPKQKHSVEIDVDKLPQKNNEKELDKAYFLYQSFQLNKFYDATLLHEAYEVYCLTVPNDLPKNTLNYVAYWITTNFTENRQKLLLTYIIKRLYPAIEKTDLEKLVTYDPNVISTDHDLLDLLQKHPVFHIAMNSKVRSEFIRDLESRHREFKDNQLLNLGLMHTDIAVALVSHSFIRDRKIDIGSVCAKYETAALLLFENSVLFLYGSIPQNLPNIIKNNRLFKIKLLENLELLVNYDVDKLVEIAKVDNDFAQKFFEDERFSQKFTIEHWFEVAKANRNFSMLLFEEKYQTLLNQLSSNQIYQISFWHKDFMLKLLEHSLEDFLKIMPPKLNNLSIRHSELGTRLLHNPNLFSQFSIYHVIGIAKGNANFALALLDEQYSEFFIERLNDINAFSNSILSEISHSLSGFAEKLLETREEKFREFQGLQIDTLVKKHPNLAKKLLEDPVRLLRFSNEQIKVIIGISKDATLSLFKPEFTAVINRLTNGDLFIFARDQVDFALRLIRDEPLKRRLGIHEPENLSNEAIEGLNVIGRHIEVVIGLMAIPKLFKHAVDGFFTDSLLVDAKNKNIQLLASPLLNQWDLVSNLRDQQIYKIAEINLDFSLRLLEDINLLTRLNSFHTVKDQRHSDKKHYLYEIALKYPEFAIKLITDEKNANIISDLSKQKLIELCLEHKGFAEVLIEKPELLKKLDDAQIVEIVKRFPELEITLLKKRKVLGSLSREQSVRLATLDVDYAVEFIRNPKNIWFSHPEATMSIINSHLKVLTTALYREPEILNNLDPALVNQTLPQNEKRVENATVALEYMSPFVSLKINFVKLFRERPNLLTEFTSTTISVIARHHTDFAMFLLNEHPTLIENMSKWWLGTILRQHRKFFDAFLLKTNFESSTDSVKANIVHAYFYHAKNNDTIAQSLFRNRQFLPFSSDKKLSEIIERKPNRALVLLKDEETFLDELSKAHLATTSMTGDGRVTNYFTDMYCNLALSNREIAIALFNRPRFLAKFSQNNLEHLAKQFPELVLNIDLNSLNIFDINQLGVLAKHSPQFALRLLLNTSLLHDQISLIQELALLSHDFALAMIKKPALIKKLVDQGHFSILNDICKKHPNFIDELVKSPEAFATLNKECIVELFSENYRNRMSIVKFSNGFKICQSVALFKRATTPEENPTKFIGDFETLRNIMLDNLLGYNTNIYLKKPPDEQSPVFSRDCLDAVAQSKNLDELRKAFTAEKIQMETLLPQQQMTETLFHHTPAHLAWLIYCLKTCDNCKLPLSFERMSKILKEFFDPNDMQRWLDQSDIPPTVKRLPIILIEKKTSLLSSDDTSTLASVLKTEIKDERIVAVPIEVEPYHWIAMTFHMNYAGNKLIACNFIDPANDDKENKPEYLYDIVEQLQRIVDPDFHGNISQYSLSFSPCDYLDSATQIPVSLRSLIKQTLSSDSHNLDLVADHSFAASFAAVRAPYRKH